MATILGSTATYFTGTHCEVTDATVTKYYYAGTQRIAMRKAGTLYFVIGDHLGSTNIITDANGAIVSETKYKAWGEVRYSSGSEITKYQFTGQFSYQSDFGLLFYNARMYDPALKRFISADSIVPPGVQGLDRYAYVNNSPMNYVDPSGHCGPCGPEIDFVTSSFVSSLFPNATEATQQAVGLVLNWFFETGPESRSFGPEEPITQDVMEQGGYDKFYTSWEASGFENGYTIPTTIEDDRSNILEWAEILVQSHVIDLPLALLGNEEHSAIPGTIGSLDYISAVYTDDGQVMITVHNTMGRESGSRTGNITWLDNEDRSETWWGGTTEQTFFWYIDAPEPKGGKPKWE